MKFNLKRIASVVIVAFLLTIMPKATLAADVNFNLQSANSDNSVVTIGYNNAYPSYYYKIALASQSSRQVAAGTFDQASGTITLTRANAPELSNLRSNDSLIITVYNPYNGYATVSESRLNIQAGAKKPSSMRILSSRLMANQNNQNLEIAFFLLFFSTENTSNFFYLYKHSINTLTIKHSKGRLRQSLEIRRQVWNFHFGKYSFSIMYLCGSVWWFNSSSPA